MEFNYQALKVMQKFKFCMILVTAMTRQGQCKIERSKRHAF